MRPLLQPLAAPTHRRKYGAQLRFRPKLGTPCMRNEQTAHSRVKYASDGGAAGGCGSSTTPSSVLAPAT